MRAFLGSFATVAVDRAGATLLCGTIPQNVETVLPNYSLARLKKLAWHACPDISPRLIFWRM